MVPWVPQANQLRKHVGWFDLQKSSHILQAKVNSFQKKLSVTRIGIIFGSRICFLHISAPDRNGVKSEFSV